MNMTKKGPTGTLSNQVGSLIRHTVNPGVNADWLGDECWEMHGQPCHRWSQLHTPAPHRCTVTHRKTSSWCVHGFETATTSAWLSPVNHKEEEQEQSTHIHTSLQIHRRCVSHSHSVSSAQERIPCFVVPASQPISTHQLLTKKRAP